MCCAPVKCFVASQQFSNTFSKICSKWWTPAAVTVVGNVTVVPQAELPRCIQHYPQEQGGWSAAPVHVEAVLSGRVGIKYQPCCSTWVLVVCLESVSNYPASPWRGSAAIKPCLDADIFETYLKNHVRHWKTETKTNGVYVCFMMHAIWEVSGCDCRFLKASKSGMCLHHGASHQLFVTFLTAFCTENNCIIAFYWH